MSGCGIYKHYLIRKDYVDNNRSRDRGFWGGKADGFRNFRVMGRGGGGVLCAGGLASLVIGSACALLIVGFACAWPFVIPLDGCTNVHYNFAGHSALPIVKLETHRLVRPHRTGLCYFFRGVYARGCVQISFEATGS